MGEDTVLTSMKIDTGADINGRGEDLIPRIRSKLTRPLAEALLAKFTTSRICLYNYNWGCGIVVSRQVGGKQKRVGFRLCGETKDCVPFCFGMPDYERFVEVIEEWLES